MTSVGQKTILIVDDEYDIVNTLEMVIMDEGYDVRTAYNGHEALLSLAELAPDLVLLDIMMPMMSGLQCLEAIRADSRFKKVPVVLMSGIRPSANLEKVGATTFIKKPFSIDEVIKLIEQTLDET